MKKRLILSTLLLICCSLFAKETIPSGMELLNELTYYTSIVVDTKNRLYLDDIYNNLLNQYEPNVIDEDIRNRITGILTDITDLKVIDLKRERLEIVYDLKKASAISAAIPNPISMLGTIYFAGASFANKDVVKGIQAIASGLNTVVSSVAMYNTASKDLLIETAEKYWNLEYDEMRIVNDLNLQSFSEQTKYGNAKNISGEFILNQKLSSQFISYIMDDNKARALETLVSNEKYYRHFPLYWLERADLCYKNQKYQECLNVINYYDEHFDYKQIYRCNVRYGQILIDGIASIFELYYEEDIDKCKELALPLIDKAVECTSLEDWFQKYYLALCYFTLSDDNSSSDFKKAYELIVSNCNQLSKSQDLLLKQYRNDLVKKTDSEMKLMQKTAKEEYEKTFKNMKDARKTELPVLNAGLMENVRLLYCLSKLGIGDISELKNSLTSSIIVPQLNEFLFGDLYAEGSYYGFDVTRFSIKKFLLGNSFTITIPAVFINNETSFYISLNDGEFYQLQNTSSLSRAELNNEQVKISVQEVLRKKSNDISDFDVKLNLTIPKDWIKNEKEAKLTLRINTAYCPIDLVFNGDSFNKLEFGWISKNYNENSFFTNFGSKDIL